MKQPEKHRIFCQNNRIREINFNLLSGLYPFGSLLFVLWISFSCQSDYVVQPVAIIPEPVSIDTTGAYPFVVDDHSIIYITDSSMYPPAELLLSSLDKDYDIEMVDSTLINLSGISLLHATDSTLPDQGYTLEIQCRQNQGQKQGQVYNQVKSNHSCKALRIKYFFILLRWKVSKILW